MTTRNDGAPEVSVQGLLIVSLLACGCLTVDDREIAVTPEPIALSSFENMTEQPLDARFGGWTYDVVNTALFTVQANVVSPGFNSNWCLQLDWEMTDPANGVIDFVGAVERTRTARPVDLRGYDRLVFTHQYVNNGACKAPENLFVRMLCNSLASGYEIVFPVSPTWRTSTLDFGKFYEVPYLAKGVALADCLAVADEIEIQALPNLQDSECSSGRLQIDDVSIR